MSRWDDPDPRVKWALDEMDFDGTEPSSLMSFYSMGVTGALCMGGMGLLRNHLSRRPLYAALPVTLAMTALGGWLGCLYRDSRIKKHAEELAVIKHYIMTHPDMFPEPERKKYSDRVVFLPWRMAR